MSLISHLFSILKHITLFICLLFCLHIRLEAQTWFFDSYGVADGLAQSKIYDLIQDDRGYVWMATATGISVFDGKVFKNYSVAEGLAPGAARSLLQDRTGKIWIGHNNGGVSIFNGKTFEKSTILDSLLNKDVTSFIETDSREIWITTSGNGVVRVTGTETGNSDYKIDHYSGGTISPMVFNSLMGNDGTLYFNTDMGIRIFDEAENIFKLFSPEKLPEYFTTTFMFQDNADNLWFGTYNGGLYRYNPITADFKAYDMRDGLAHNWISYITQDTRGNMWIGTWGGGITRINDDEIISFNINNGLADNFIRCISEDAEGNILIGTNENGLEIFKGDQFTSYQVADGLIDPQVWAVCQDSQGRFWIGTQSGISLLDPSLPAAGSFSNFTNFGDFSLERVRYIKEDLNGNIWISTDIDGIGMYDSKSGVFHNFTYEFLNLYLLPRGSLNPTAMEIDRNNNLWLGTNSGISWYNIDSGESGTFTQGDGIAGNDISSLYYDSEGLLWVGSSGRGLACISEDMTIMPVDLKEEITPLCMTEDKEGYLYIGTESQGVIVFDGETIINRIGLEEGLLGNYISLITSEGNNIYIGTSRGLNIYNTHDQKIFTYTGKNGFTGIEAKRNAGFADRDGSLWFGTVEGVMVYVPDAFSAYSSEPNTHLTGLQVNYADREIKNGLQLSYSENSIIFNYNSISLSNPGAIRFRIMLEGADADWRPVTRETTAIYPDLSPGRYVFRVMASNSQNIWSSEPVGFSFSIRPPWYRSWWGISLFILTGIAIIIMYVRRREKKLKKEKHILEEKVTERTAEISEKNQLLAIKNKDITDSINYAKRIQDALLPAEDLIPEGFVFFRPKDIVSGDFYWIMAQNGTEFVAAVDCTGHGVPGAFMSIIGHNGLNKIVGEMNICQPGKILDKLNEEVYDTLHQNSLQSENVKDGMDMALIAWNKDTGILEYSGAYNSLYLIRNNELTEIKADKIAIGQSLTDLNFTNHQIKIEKGDCVYIFSDGYADQFGGEKGKKFMSRALKKLLTDVNGYTVSQQKLIIEKTFLEWMEGYEQLDDVLVIGRKF